MNNLAAQSTRLWLGAFIYALSSSFVSVDAPAQRASHEDQSRYPILVLQTDGQPVVDRTRIAVRLDVACGPKASNANVGENAYHGRAELWVRGNTSYYFQKKSYRLELQNESGNDTKAPLLGMPADSDWVLYASVTDRTSARHGRGHDCRLPLARYGFRWRLGHR